MRTEQGTPPETERTGDEVRSLVILESPDEELVGNRIALEHDHLIIGRSEDESSHLTGGALWLADEQVSFLHAVLRQSEGKLLISDRGSTNGTYLDGQVLQEEERREVCWKPGQQLRIGQTLIKGFGAEDVEAQSYESMHDRSFRDPLTGAHNRRYFDQSLERSVAASSRSERSMALCFLDIDHFKQVNDEHGHDAGDQVLREFVSCVGGRVRSSDLLARFGGEEFIVLLEDVGEDRAVQIADELRERIEQEEFDIGTERIHLTASLGVAALEEGESGETLLKRADDNCYRAKAEGRNRVCR